MSISVVVASRSAPKLSAALRGFERFTSVEVQGVEVTSGVAAQPVGHETRRGALNRLKAARSTREGSKADFCMAFEGGVEINEQGRYVCFAVAPRQIWHVEAVESIVKGMRSYYDEDLKAI